MAQYETHMPLPDFKELCQTDWIAAFLEYASHGECSPRIMFWVAVSTLGAALQRKVYIQHGKSQWSPNFFILLVGEQGETRKSSSIDAGMDLFQGMDFVALGPDSCTWQAMLLMMGRAMDGEKKGSVRMLTWPSDGSVNANKPYVYSGTTLPISEFGTFFQTDNVELRDLLTDLWDGKMKPWTRLTKTAGDDIIPRPWINFIAGTTPAWIAANFRADFLQTGLSSRFIFLRGEPPIRDIAYPEERPDWMLRMEQLLRARLEELVAYAGVVKVSPEAKEWGTPWYSDILEKQRAMPKGSLARGFMSRKQCHAHKIAMVLAASRNHLPIITLEDLQEAARRLEPMDAEACQILGMIGQTKITAASQAIIDAVYAASGPVGVSRLYADRFCGTMEADQYRDAVSGACLTSKVYLSDKNQFLNKRTMDRRASDVDTGER